MVDAIGTEAANQLMNTMLDELLSDLDALAGRLRRLSTARLQEMRRAVDAELARRMQPHEDLRDGKGFAFMNEAVERATRAAFEQFYNSGWPPKTFDSELRTADEWRSAMRIAILALREPSEAMLEAARDWSRRRFGAPVGNDVATTCWQAMIDGAVR